ncbi:hypothetical protein BpHYR1_036837 [Brachionus plicatilis]|uniref:Uncharacterized protein n=1 Tax=Brachionus plicatilis TaxID=10195 RepID=A0A3M7RGW4_BRAPC|nr:hypothetical protein BpHYR1_036837 [Brachionus plicatilis]
MNYYLLHRLFFCHQKKIRDEKISFEFYIHISLLGFNQSANGLKFTVFTYLYFGSKSNIKNRSFDDHNSTLTVSVCERVFSPNKLIRILFMVLRGDDIYGQSLGNKPKESND